MLGLPGNPVSTLVCALIFLRPAIATMLGVAGKHEEQTQAARLVVPLPANDRRTDYLRATLSRDAAGGLSAMPFAPRDSSSGGRPEGKNYVSIYWNREQPVH